VSRQQLLDALSYSHDQLVWRQIVAGTDYNESPDRVAWGRAGTIIDGCDTFEQVIASAKEWDGKDREWDADRWRDVYEWFQNPEVSGDVTIEDDTLSVSDTYDYLVGRHGLDGQQVQSRLRSIVEGL